MNAGRTAARTIIQGLKIVIEFSPQGVGGDPTMHVHTIYCDPTNVNGCLMNSAGAMV